MIEVYGAYFLLTFCILIILRRWFNNPRSPKKKLLILDINNLLVSRAYSLKQDDPEIWPMAQDYINQADMLGTHYTWKRPDLDVFIHYCLQNFTVAVWSSAWPQNVDRLCEYIFTPKQRSQLLFEWNQSMCHRVDAVWMKNLSVVWSEYPQYSAENTIILDNSDAKMENNPTDCVGICDTWYPWTNDHVETLETVRAWLDERK